MFSLPTFFASSKQLLLAKPVLHCLVHRSAVKNVLIVVFYLRSNKT